MTARDEMNAVVQQLYNQGVLDANEAVYLKTSPSDMDLAKWLDYFSETGLKSALPGAGNEPPPRPQNPW